MLRILEPDVRDHARTFATDPLPLICLQPEFKDRPSLVATTPMKMRFWYPYRHPGPAALIWDLHFTALYTKSHDPVARGYTIREAELLHADENGWQDTSMHRMRVFESTSRCSLPIEIYQDNRHLHRPISTPSDLLSPFHFRAGHDAFSSSPRRHCPEASIA